MCDFFLGLMKVDVKEALATVALLLHLSSCYATKYTKLVLV